MATLAPLTITESTNESTLGTTGAVPSGFPSSCQTHIHVFMHTFNQTHTDKLACPKDTPVVSHQVSHPNRPFLVFQFISTSISTKRELAQY